MGIAQHSQTTTRMFSRVIGPFLVISCVTAVARASEMQELLAQFEANSLWTWVAGSFALMLGLIVVASHQYWGDPAAIIVSALGWLVVLRGVLLLAFPTVFVSIANSMIGAQAWWITLCVVFVLVGLYLTYVGYRPAPHQPRSHAGSSRTGLSNAA